MSGVVGLLGGTVELFEQSRGKLERRHVGEDIAIEIKHFGAGEGAERLTLSLSVAAIANDNIGDRKEFNAAGEAGLFLADAAGEGGNLTFRREEVEDAVGLAVVRAAKDDGVSAKVSGHGRGFR